MCKLRIKLKVPHKTNVVALATKQHVVNESLVTALEHQVKLAKEGKISCLALMAYCAGQEDRWYSFIKTAGMLTATDCFVFTESLSRQVFTMRNITDDIIESKNAESE